jgi:hypothetical protein
MFYANFDQKIILSLKQMSLGKLATLRQCDPVLGSRIKTVKRNVSKFEKYLITKITLINKGA